MKLELGTQLIGLFDIGMYNGHLDPGNVIDIESDSDYWDRFDNEKYKKFILECCDKVLEEDVRPYLRGLNLGIKSIKSDSIYSPKSYNYGGDELYFDIEIEGNLSDFYEKFKESYDTSDLANFIEKNNGSRPGFSSFLPKTLKELEDSIKDSEDDERNFSTLLNFILSEDEVDFQEEINELVNSLVEPDSYIKENLSNLMTFESFSEKFDEGEKDIKTREDSYSVKNYDELKSVIEEGYEQIKDYIESIFDEKDIDNKEIDFEVGEYYGTVKFSASYSFKKGMESSDRMTPDDSDEHSFEIYDVEFKIIDEDGNIVKDTSEILNNAFKDLEKEIRHFEL